MTNTSLGYIFQTGAAGADTTPFQQLVTIDAPRRGDVIHSCTGRQGAYFLTKEFFLGEYSYYVHVLPSPGGTTDTIYEKAPKQEYMWRSKKFVMPGRTTFGACKVVHGGGCARIKIFADGCCVFSTVVTECSPFRLSDQVVGVEFEIELTGTAIIYEAHIASSMQELTINE